MKKMCIGIILLVFGINSIAFAKIYDLSQISQAKHVSEYSADTTVDEMDTVTFGSYPQSDVSGNTKEPIEWIVLDRQGDKVLLLSKYVLNCKCFNVTGNIVNWNNCSLRNWLNSDFINNAFNKKEKMSIQSTRYSTQDLPNSVDGGVENTFDDIFLLSENEIFKYFGDPRGTRGFTT